MRDGHARIPADRLREQTVAVLTARAVPDDLASPTAEVMRETDLCGVDSHGIAMLPAYAAQLLTGEVHATARPRVIRETGVSLTVDAAHGLGHPAALLGMRRDEPGHVHRAGAVVSRRGTTGITAGAGR